MKLKESRARHLLVQWRRDSKSTGESSHLDVCLCVILQGALDNINLFQVITIMAFFMLLPVSIALEGLPALPASLAAAVSSRPRFWGASSIVSRKLAVLDLVYDDCSCLRARPSTIRSRTILRFAARQAAAVRIVHTQTQAGTPTCRSFCRSCTS